MPPPPGPDQGGDGGERRCSHRGPGGCDHGGKETGRLIPMAHPEYLRGEVDFNWTSWRVRLRSGAGEADRPDRVRWRRSPGSAPPP